MVDTAIKNIRTPLNQLKQLLQQLHNTGFFHLFSSNLFIQIFTFASFFIIAWILDPADIGRLLILQSYVEILSILCGMGLNTSIVKLCAERKILGEKKFLFNLALRYTIIFTAIIYIFIFILSQSERIIVDPFIRKLMPIYALVLFPKVINLAALSYLRALKEFKSISFIQSGTKLISLLMVVLATYWFQLHGYLAALITGITFTTFVLFIKIKATHGSVQSIKTTAPFKTHWQLAKYAFTANILTRLGLYADMIIIGNIVKDTSQIGYYAFGKNLLLGLNVFIATAQQMTTTYFAETSDNFFEWKRRFRVYQRLFISAAVVIASTSYVCAAPVLNFLFQGKYDHSVIFFKILCAAWLIRTLYSLKGPALIGLGKIQYNLLSSALVLPFSIGFMLILALNFDVIGIAFANVLSCSIAYVFTSIFFYKFFKREAV